MQRAFIAQHSPRPAVITSWVVDSTTASTSGRPTSGEASVADAPAELCQQGAEVDALRRRQAAAESKASCGLAPSNEAVAAGLRTALDTLLLGGAAPAQPAEEEGFGDSGPGLAAAAADGAESCC
ncbi:putative BOI-related E3 ubiquitin-protein ligase 3 [Panicum miliaceum]|uniref:BOI-related E3 ubiquitin-protein ligase 3 n=1 Tax=Panicum miliaceum TaxID=4540 RepID=A0A3L6PZV4_PANMI|nr:putative BOI-related E3 ubiquitin-protein ligase 3 [Panicum miliaceum]